MPPPIISQARNWGAALCLALAVLSVRAAAPCVELTAEIELNAWSYWLLEDKKGGADGRDDAARSIFQKPMTVRCVVGTNTWMMEGPFVRNGKVTRWFTGTDIVEETVITDTNSDPRAAEMLNAVGLQRGTNQVGDRHTRIYETVDGNPGRPAHVADLFPEAHGNICWLAFCSGPALKQEGRRIPLPSSVWKQFFSGADFADETTAFADGLGLPKRIEVFTRKDQPLLQYQVRSSSNVLGWNFPLEFYLVQYNRARWPLTNSWEMRLTAKGRVTALSATNAITPPPK